MTDARIILRNLTANWIGHGANLVVMFFLSPFIIHTLGVTEYGIWQLLTVFTGYLGVLDLGVRASTGRYIILYLGQEEYAKVDETIRTGLGLYTLLSSLILIVGFMLGFLFPIIFPTIPQEFHMTIVVLLPILAVNLWISALRSVLSSILVAHDRFDFARGSDLIMLFVRTIGTIIVLKLNMGLVGLTLAVIVCNVVGLCVNYYLCCLTHKNLKLWPLILKKERIKEFYSYGFGAFLIIVSDKIIGQTDLVLVGNLINLKMVTVYSVGAMLIYYSNTFIKEIANTFFPSLQRAVIRNEKGNTRWILFRQIRLVLIMGILMYVGYFSYGKSFITLWMFHPVNFPMESVLMASYVMSILSIAKIILLFGSFNKNILAASGNIGFAAKMNTLEAITNLVLSIFFVLVLKWGIIGIAAGTFFAHLIFQAIILPYHACKTAGISWIQLVVVIGGRGALTGILFGFICYMVQSLLILPHWFGFFLQIIVSVMFYLPIAFVLMVPKDDQKRIISKGVSIFKRLA